MFTRKELIMNLKKINSVSLINVMIHTLLCACIGTMTTEIMGSTVPGSRLTRQITLRSPVLAGERITLPAGERWTWGQLKQSIAAQIGIPAHRLVIITDFGRFYSDRDNELISWPDVGRGSTPHIAILLEPIQRSVGKDATIEDIETATRCPSRTYAEGDIIVYRHGSGVSRYARVTSQTSLVPGAIMAEIRPNTVRDVLILDIVGKLWHEIAQ